MFKNEHAFKLSIPRRMGRKSLSPDLSDFSLATERGGGCHGGLHPLPAKVFFGLHMQDAVAIGSSLPAGFSRHGVLFLHQNRKGAANKASPSPGLNFKLVGLEISKALPFYIIREGIHHFCSPGSRTFGIDVGIDKIKLSLVQKVKGGLVFFWCFIHKAHNNIC